MKRLRDRIVEKIGEEMLRQRISRDELAALCGFACTRTVHRLLTGETFSIETVEKVEEALQVSIIDSACHEEAGKRRKATESAEPVSGWRQAARQLRVAPTTLRDQRRAFGCDLQRPWWESPEALRAWYRDLLTTRRRSGRPTPRPPAEGAPR